MASKSNKCLTLDQKIKVIEAKEKDKLSVKEICTLFNCGKSQVYNVFKFSNELKELWMNGNRNMKRKPKSNENDEINDLTWKWFMNSRENNEPITGSSIQTKARQIAKQLSIKKFKASNGWLERFKIRHNISLLKNGESGKSIGVSSINKKEEGSKLNFKNCELKNVYIGDETGLFFRKLPNITLPVGNRECKDGELSQERLTLFVCVNMEGEFEKPLVIGKEKASRYFKNLSPEQLPVNWCSNNKVWMTNTIMNDWLHTFNNKMKKENRKVILLLDHSICHPYLKLSNVRIVLSPANTTLLIQLLNQKIIYSIKVNYRIMILQSLLASVNGTFNVENSKNEITLLDAIYWLSESVNQIKSDAVKQCFFKGDLKSDLDQQTDELLFYFEQLYLTINTEVNSKEYMNIDMNLCTSGGELDIQNEDDVQFDSDNEINQYNKPLSTDSKNDIKPFEDALNEIKRLELLVLNQHHENNLIKAIINVKYELEKTIVSNKIKLKNIKIK